MKGRHPIRKLLHWWKSLYLTDRFLLIFMVILQVQSIRTLFFNTPLPQDAGALDVVVRTTAASIFGYFISAGFRGEATRMDAGDPPATSVQAAVGTGKPTAQIGFSTDPAVAEAPRLGGAHTVSSASNSRRIRQQTIIVAVLGISSLVMLVLARDFGKLSADSTATLSQLRDFISGSVGFLIGHAAKDAK